MSGKKLQDVSPQRKSRCVLLLCELIFQLLAQVGKKNVAHASILQEPGVSGKRSDEEEAAEILFNHATFRFKWGFHPYKEDILWSGCSSLSR
jgi:hypothetical protein